MDGFCLSLANGDPEKWYWKACGYRSGSDRPTVSKTTINEAELSQAGFFVNGTTMKETLNTATLGATGQNIYVGRGNANTAHQAGWWSHLEIGARTDGT